MLDGFFNEKELTILDTVKDLRLTDEETKTLKWLASWDVETVKNICTIIKKAKKSGRKNMC